MYGRIKPKGLPSRRDVQSEYGGQQYYNVLYRGKEENLSDTDFYSLSDEEAAAPPVYSVVKKKNQAKAAEQKYLYIEAKLDRNLPYWLKTASLSRSWRQPLRPAKNCYKEDNEIVIHENIPPPPPPRREKNGMMNKRPSWRQQYDSNASSLGSTGTTSQSMSMSPSPQISKLPFKKPNPDSKSIRRPTNFDHHQIKCFANSIWKKTSKAFQVSSSSNASISSRGTSNMSTDNIQTTGNVALVAQEKSKHTQQAHSPFGSNTSINSIWTEDGRLITPPPRKKSLSRQNLSTDLKQNFEIERNCSSSNSWRGFPLDKSSFAAASDSSINRIQTPTGLLSPPERIKSKLSFGSSGLIGRSNHKPNRCNASQTLKPDFSSTCRSNDSINRVITPHGIITPPPRRFFNRSTLSLQNTIITNKASPASNNRALNEHVDHQLNQTDDLRFDEDKDNLPYADSEQKEEVINSRIPKVSEAIPKIMALIAIV